LRSWRYQQIYSKAGMELRHLRHFVAVAEELHFGRAARRLGMSQPPLSQSIQRLEASLGGVQLLQRSRRDVALTAAGRVLLEEGRRVLAQADVAERLTLRAASGDLRRMRIGFTPAALFGVLPAAIRQFRQRWSAIEIQLEEQLSAQQIPNLLDGQIDIGFVVHHGAGVEGLMMQTLERVPLVAAVPAGSALASRRSVSLPELAAQPMIASRPAWSPSLHAAITAAFRAAGCEPNVVQEAGQTYTMLSLVANDVGVALVPESARSISVPGVALRPVANLPPDLHVEWVVAWSAAAANPVIDHFVELCCDLAARRRNEAVASPAHRRSR